MPAPSRVSADSRSRSPLQRFVIVVLGIGSIALWRAYTGTAPETDRVVATRQLQARAAQASEQLVEKTKGLEATQQESIDQLQVVQDQLQTVRRLLAAQQADTKKLSEQVGTLTEAIDGLRQSFASAQASEPAAAAAPRKRSVKAKPAQAGAQTAAAPRRAADPDLPMSPAALQRPSIAALVEMRCFAQPAATGYFPPLRRALPQLFSAFVNWFTYRPRESRACCSSPDGVSRF